MSDNVRISNIDEISEHVAKIYALMASYKEICEEEYRELAVLDFEVSDCIQFMKSRKSEYEIALEQTKSNFIKVILSKVARRLIALIIGC